MSIIYGIFNSLNGRVYVGCTAGKLSKRFREHRCLLNHGRHAESELQSDWNAVGSAAFSISSVADLGDVGVAQKRTAELFWMESFEANGRLYNRNRNSFQLSPEAHRKGIANAHKSPGLRWTSEANEKRRLAQLGRPKGHGAKISATKKARRACAQ